MPAWTQRRAAPHRCCGKGWMRCGRAQAPRGDRSRAMARRMKVFEARLGFYDTVVAVPSRAAALRAWGVSQDLFKEGQARESEDAGAIKAAKATPEVVLRRPAGGKGRFEQQPAALPEAPPARRRSPDRPQPAIRAGARKPPAPPKPDRRALDQAEAALADLQARQTAEMAALEAKRLALDEQVRATRRRPGRQAAQGGRRGRRGAQGLSQGRGQGLNAARQRRPPPNHRADHANALVEGGFQVRGAGRRAGAPSPAGCSEAIRLPTGGQARRRFGGRPSLWRRPWRQGRPSPRAPRSGAAPGCRRRPWRPSRRRARCSPRPASGSGRPYRTAPPPRRCSR